jgi:hypothetical protein
MLVTPLAGKTFPTTLAARPLACCLFLPAGGGEHFSDSASILRELLVENQWQNFVRATRFLHAV